MPNQGAVMLLQALRSAAVELSNVLVESFRRFKAHKQHSVRRTAFSAGADAEQIEANLNQGVLTASPPKKSAAREKKIDVKAAA